MNTVQNKLESLHLSIWINQAHQKQSSIKSIKNRKLNLLAPLRQWLNNIEVKDSAFAHRVCQLIPSQCPFEREIKLFGRTIAKIPPMCKLNPLYNEVIALRFRAICYLADVCGEDVSVYC
jgi:hypothetical protein